MKQSTFRGVAILVFILATVFFMIPNIIQMVSPDSIKYLPDFWGSKKLKLGLDLRGGMQILLDVDTSKLPEKEKDGAVKSAIEVIRNRIDQFGVAEPSIQRVGSDRIMVQLPGLKEINRAKDLIGKTALLEFKLVAEGEQVKSVMNAMDIFLSTHIDRYRYLNKFNEQSKEPKTANAAADILKNKAASVDSTKATIDSLLAADSGHIFTNLTGSGKENMSVAYEDIALVQTLLSDSLFVNAIPSGFQIALGKEDKNDPKADREIYVLFSNAEVTGKYLSFAQTKIGSGYDPKTANKPYISFKFNREGAKKFDRLTGDNVKKRLAIVLDGIVYVAPVIQDRISRGEGQITGNFTLQECNDLVIVLKAGNLPAPVSIAEERTVGSTLGSDSIKAGAMATGMAFLFIVLFMLLYYGFSGLLADFALVINIFFIMAMMSMFQATLTLPGIAGIILTFGMAVDANVLIFERIREELKAGKTVRSAVESGFSRAMVTIWDSNLTTLIAAAVLYQFGTGPIRGFAVTLSIGILGSMFCAIVIVKAIFDNFVTKNNPSKLSI
jgi:SecD/SecF fusion protein